MRISDEENAGLLLETIPKVMMMIREELRTVAKSQFTIPQFRILNQLRIRARSNGELAAWMGVTPPTLSRMVDALETRGMLQRETDPNDRRAQVITLTAVGRREIERIRRFAKTALTARVERLQDPDTALLNQGLTLLSDLTSSKASSKANSNRSSVPERKTPAMKPKMRILMSLFALAFFASSCLGDRTQEDYLREQSAAENAKFQEIQGQYQGTLVSKETGAVLGRLSMNLDVRYAPQPANDNTTARKTIAIGTLDYSGLDSGRINFNQVYYDDQTRTLSAQINAKDSSQSARTILMVGTFSGDTLSGEMMETSLGGYVAEFKLVKNGPAVARQNLSSARVLYLSEKTQKFQGAFLGADGSSDSCLLSVEYLERSSEELFLKLFLPERAVNVSVSCDGHPFPFTSAHLNELQNTLQADADTRSSGGAIAGGAAIHVSMNCSRSFDERSQAQWTCGFISGLRSYSITFTSGSVASGKKE